MKYTTVFLDFDDTLIDTQGYASKCLYTLYAKHGLDKYFDTPQTFITKYHKHLNKLWEDYALGKINKETLNGTRFDKTFEDIEGIERDFLTHLSEDFLNKVVKIDMQIDGAQEILEYLKPKYKIVMLSNGFSELQYEKLKSVGFTAFFDDVVLSDILTVNKPHPDIFNFALEKNGTTAEKTIMIGDNYLSDIKGAMDSGIDQIWYNPKKEKVQNEPTYTVEKLLEIVDIL